MSAAYTIQFANVVVPWVEVAGKDRVNLLDEIPMHVERI
jgi:hypothetical protein